MQDIFFRPGEYAPAMTPVVSILPPGNVYVRFFVPETEFSKVKLGQKVSVTCDGCGQAITATVTFIAAQEEFTPPVIFSIGNREKLVFKVEARAPGGLRCIPGNPSTCGRSDGRGPRHRCARADQAFRPEGRRQRHRYRRA